MAQAMDDNEALLATLRMSLSGSGRSYIPATNARTTQLLVGAGQTPVYSSGDESVPRRLPPTDSLVPLVKRSRRGLVENAIEPHDTLKDTVEAEEAQATEQCYITVPAPPGSNTATDDPWDANRSEIERLYMKENYTLPEVMKIMASRGFEAPDHAYKRRFTNWGWRTYGTVKNYAKPGNKPSTPRSRAGRRRGRRSTSTCTMHEIIPTQSGFGCSAGAVVQSTCFGLGSPTAMQQTERDTHFAAILSQVRNLYLGSIEQEKWQVKNRFVVEEDIHDDLLVGVGTALRDFDSQKWQECVIGGMAIRKAFVALEKVVVNCGLFSLPSIWESYLRMIRKGRREIARMFLLHVLQISKDMASYTSNHPFVQVIRGLLRLEKTDPDMLKHVILCAYRSCIDHVAQKLTLSHLTTLSLWSDYVVYMDNSSASETKQAVDSFRSLILKSENDNGVDDDFTLEILGLSLYVLQSTDSTAAEAELVALDMFCRVNRRIKSGEKLEGSLLILWKDLKHTLGNFCYAKGERRAAVRHLEECLVHGVVDDRDFIALKSLEEWYDELGELGEAERVHQLRISSSQKLFQEDKIEVAEREGFGNDVEARSELCD